MKRHLYWFAYKEPYIPHETMVERMTGSTSSSNKVHEVVDKNNNLYRNIVMEAMRMNQSYAGQCPIVDEELNADVTRFFDFLKDSNEPLWDGCTSHIKLSIVVQAFTIKSDHRLSEADYNKIIE
jgi:hypothetical protein